VIRRNRGVFNLKIAIPAAPQARSPEVKFQHTFVKSFGFNEQSSHAFLAAGLTN
jgi:hypothetical protein